jgi:hypothetical protein
MDQPDPDPDDDLDLADCSFIDHAVAVEIALEFALAVVAVLAAAAWWFK